MGRVRASSGHPERGAGSGLIAAAPVTVGHTRQARRSRSAQPYQERCTRQMAAGPAGPHRIGGMSRQGPARRRGGMADAADLGSAAHRAWGFKSPRRHQRIADWGLPIADLVRGSAAQSEIINPKFAILWARGLAGRRLPCTEKIAGSNPAGSTHTVTSAVPPRF